MDQIERIEAATSLAASKVGKVQASDLTKPTPCADFDVTALLNHMLGGLTMLNTAAGGGKASIPEGIQFGSDPSAVYTERRDAFLATLRQPGVLDRTWEMHFAPMAGQMMANIAFMEHLTHAWDVAKATGQDTTLPTELVTDCMQVVTAMGDMLRMPGVCAQPVAVPDGASEQDRFIAFLGRTP